MFAYEFLNKNHAGRDRFYFIHQRANGESDGGEKKGEKKKNDRFLIYLPSRFSLTWVKL